MTAPTQEAANEICSTLPSALQESAVLLAVPDATSLKVGSGAATLNALLTVAEELSARAGFSTLSAEPLRDARVLVLHSGASARGGSPNPCLPQALTSLPTFGTVPGEAEAVSMAEWAVRTASRLFADMPPGLVVCCGSVFVAADMRQALAANEPTLFREGDWVFEHAGEPALLMGKL